MSNDENTKQLIDIIYRVWTSDAQDRKITPVKESKAYMIKADDPEKTKVEQIATLKSTQEETDSRIVVYSTHASREGYKVWVKMSRH